MSSKKDVAIALLISILIHCVMISIARAEENTMHFTTKGIVFPCLNEDTHPWGTCFMVEGNRWGQHTPNYNPAPGDTVTVEFTFTRITKIAREHEDMFYVSNMKVLIPTQEN